jgi:F5/8 type C domain/Dolichyl-phosphate-mannose-protein mannosyltransferase
VLPVATLLLLGAAVRALRFGGRFAVKWHWDEATPAIQAIHILQGVLPIHFLGLEYMGATAAYPLAVWFELFGPSTLALDLFAYGVGLVMLWTGYLVARRILDPPAALLALTVLAAPPLLLARRSLDASLDAYQFLLILGNLFLLGTHTIFFRSPARPRTLLAMGLLAGVGFWTNPLFVVYLAPFGWLALRTGLAWQARGALFASGAVVGSLPAWLYELRYFPSGRFAVHDVGTVGARPLGERVPFVVGQYLPSLLGIDDLTNRRWPGDLVTATVVLLAVFAVGRAMRRDATDLAWALGARRHPASSGRVLLWGVFLANLTLVLATPRGAESERYLLPLYTVLPCWLGETLAWLSRKRRAVWAAVLATVLGFHLWSNWVDTFGGVPPSQRRWTPLKASMAPLAGWLQEHRYDRVYWGDDVPDLPAFEFTYLTGGRIVAANLWRETAVADADLVDASPSPPIVTRRNAGALPATLRGLGMEVRATAVGSFIVLEAAPAFSTGFAQIPPLRWVATASHSPEAAGNVLDRDAATGWSAGGGEQVPGQWLTVDLRTEMEVTRVDLLPLDWREVPAGFRVDVSTTGEEWRTVASVPEYGGPLFFSERHPFLKVRRGRVQAVFPAVLVRFVRIMQTGRDPYHEWSVRELFVYRPVRLGEPGPAPDVIVATLRREGVRRVYANHWLSAAVRVASRGDIETSESNLFANSYGRTFPDLDDPSRLPRFAIKPGYAVLTGSDTDGDELRNTLRLRGVAFTEASVGPYRLLVIRRDPPAPRPLPKDGWKATASDNPDQAHAAVDGDRRTGWTSTLPAGHRVTVTLDLAAIREVARIRLTPGSAENGGRSARELRLEGSADGIAWDALEPLRWGGRLYWSGSELLADGTGAWELVFPSTRVRYLRLSGKTPWTIRDVECFAGES